MESTGTRVVVDAFQIAGVPALWRYDEMEPRIDRTGTWVNTADANMAGGYYRHASGAGSARTRRSTAPRSSLSHRWHPTTVLPRSISTGSKVAEVDQYRSSYANKQVVWSSGVLSAGNHTLKIVAKGDKRPESTGTRIVVDALDVAGTLRTADLVPPTTSGSVQPRYVDSADITFTASDTGSGVAATICASTEARGRSPAPRPAPR